MVRTDRTERGNKASFQASSFFETIPGNRAISSLIKLGRARGRGRESERARQRERERETRGNGNISLRQVRRFKRGSCATSRSRRSLRCIGRKIFFRGAFPFPREPERFPDHVKDAPFSRNYFLRWSRRRVRPILFPFTLRWRIASLVVRWPLRPAVRFLRLRSKVPT